LQNGNSLYSSVAVFTVALHKQKKKMEKLNQKKTAIASGTASLVVYLGCFLVMTIMGKDAIVKLSNLLFHGMDFSNIIRMNIPIGETFLGAIISFVFWGIIGYFFAFIFNKLK
jgi:hypothetical protein